MRILLLLALAAVASAETGWIEPVCPHPDDFVFRTSRHAICLTLYKEPKKFEEAEKYCQEKNSRLMTLQPKTRKPIVLSHIIIEKFHDLHATAWFVDPAHVPHEPAEANSRLVFFANKDPKMIKLVRNDTDIERPFVCESPAQPTTRRPQFYLQPENIQISEEVIQAFKNRTVLDTKKPKAFVVSFHCRAFALQKPSIEWRFIFHNETSNELETRPINAKVIHSLAQAMKEMKTDGSKTLFFDKRRDCKSGFCHPDGIMESSELIIVNPQLLDLSRRLICVANNSGDAVMSRDAEFIVGKMDNFPEEPEKISAKVGQNLTIPCKLATEPDASAQWFYVNKEGKEVGIEVLNHRTGGNVQTSMATFDLLIDSLTIQNAGRYICRVQMHNGRFHFVSRDRLVDLTVEPCEDCQPADKPVKVVDGYPTYLSMNPMSNVFIRTGDAFLLECPCSGKRNVKEMLGVEWNTTLAANSMHPLSLLPIKSAVLVEQANVEHSGTYSCRCLRGEQTSNWSSVDVAVLPLFAPEEMPLVVAKENQTVSIDCQLPNVQINGVKIFVTPMRGIRSLFDILHETKDDRFSLTDKNEKYTITIKDVKAKDAGTYGCRLSIDYFGEWKEHDTYYTSLRVEQ